MIFLPQVSNPRNFIQALEHFSAQNVADFYLRVMLAKVGSLELSHT